jgi:hypothetical protein
MFKSYVTESGLYCIQERLSTIFKPPEKLLKQAAGIALLPFRETVKNTFSPALRSFSSEVSDGN